MRETTVMESRVMHTHRARDSEREKERGMEMNANVRTHTI